MKNKRTMFMFLVATMILAVSFTACNNNHADSKKIASQALVLYSLPFFPGPSVDYSDRETPQRGRLLTAQPLWDLPLSYIENFVSYYLSYIGKTLADYPTLAPQSGVVYYCITYETIDTKGVIVQASASVWIPRTDASFPILAFCHGTTTSTNISNIRLLPGLFAGRGFLAVGPDYLGYGVSEQIHHPYLHAATLASSTIDSIRAAKKLAQYLGISLNGKLFVSGISEGGMAAMATICELEKNYTAEHPLTAGAPISGPYDMTGSVDFYIKPGMILSGSQRSYMVFLLPVYSEIYSFTRPVNHFIQEPYASWFVEDPLPRPHAARVISDLPSNTDDLLTADFMTEYLGGGETEFRNAIDLNSTYKFVPQCYLRMYAANQDTNVPPANADTAYAYFTGNSAPHVSLEKIDGDHGTTALPFTVNMLDWFSTF
jgi:pimeloyl-ACP methyl ester carboxylesterase